MVASRSRGECRWAREEEGQKAGEVMRVRAGAIKHEFVIAALARIFASSCELTAASIDSAFASAPAMPLALVHMLLDHLHGVACWLHVRGRNQQHTPPSTSIVVVGKDVSTDMNYQHYRPARSQLELRSSQTRRASWLRSSVYGFKFRMLVSRNRVLFG